MVRALQLLIFIFKRADVAFSVFCVVDLPHNSITFAKYSSKANFIRHEYTTYRFGRS